MPSLPRALRAYVRDAAGAFRLAPLEVLLGVAVAATFSASQRDPGSDWWLRIATTAALVLPLLFGASVLRARGVVGRGARWAASAAVLALGAGYAAWVFDPDRQAEAWRFAALLGACWLALTLVPAVGVRGEARRRLALWHFNFHLLARIVTVVVYGVALFAALAGAVAAVSTLFELRTPDHLYLDLMGVIFFALVPWVVAGGIPELVAAPEVESAHERRGVRLLGRYLYFPVLVVYLAILLAYAAKVAVTGEFPRNLLSPIVLLAGLFGFLGSLLVEPLRRHPEHTGVARLIRVLPALLLPLLPLAVWAVWMRRDQYGWTELRWLRFGLLLALALLALVGTYRLLRRREPLLVSIPAVLGVALLAMAVGPWSATAVSLRSQQARLHEGLREAGLAREGRVVALAAPGVEPEEVRTIPRELHQKVVGSLVYLYDAHGPEAVEEVLGREVEGFRGGWQVASALPVRAGCPAGERRWASASLPQGTALPEMAGGTLYRISAGRGARGVRTEEGGDVRVALGPAFLSLAGKGWTARADLRPLAARTLDEPEPGCGERARAEVPLRADEARLELRDPSGRVRGEVVVMELRVEHDPDARPSAGPQVRHLSGVAVVRE